MRRCVGKVAAVGLNDRPECIMAMIAGLGDCHSPRWTPPTPPIQRWFQAPPPPRRGFPFQALLTRPRGHSSSPFMFATEYRRARALLLLG